MVQAEESYLAKHSTGDLSSQKVARTPICLRRTHTSQHIAEDWELSIAERKRGYRNGCCGWLGGRPASSTTGRKTPSQSSASIWRQYGPVGCRVSTFDSFGWGPHRRLSRLELQATWRSLLGCAPVDPAAAQEEVTPAALGPPDRRTEGERVRERMSLESPDWTG